MVLKLAQLPRWALLRWGGRSRRSAGRISYELLLSTTCRGRLTQKDGVSEDDVRGAETQLDALKDDFIGMIDAAQAQKEEELLEV